MHIDMPTRDDVGRLASARGPFSVTIYLPTTTLPTDAELDQLSARVLVENAITRVRQHGDPPSTDVVEENLVTLVDHTEFRSALGRSVAVFVTARGIVEFRPPNELGTYVSVSDRFAITPLLRAISFPHATRVGNLAERCRARRTVRADTPSREVEVPGMPRSAVGLASIGARSPYGRIQGDEGRMVRVAQHAQAIDHALRPVVNGQALPVILAAAVSLATTYRSLTGYLYLVEFGTVDGNSDEMSEAQLADQARVVLDQVHADELAQLHVTFLDRGNGGRASTDLSDLARAAAFGAIATLAVGMDAQVPGTVGDGGALLYRRQFGSRCDRGDHPPGSVHRCSCPVGAADRHPRGHARSWHPSIQNLNSDTLRGRTMVGIAGSAVRRCSRLISGVAVFGLLVVVGCGTAGGVASLAPRTGAVVVLAALTTSPDVSGADEQGANEQEPVGSAPAPDPSNQPHGQNERDLAASDDEPEPSTIEESVAPSVSVPSDVTMGESGPVVLAPAPAAVSDESPSAVSWTIAAGVLVVSGFLLLILRKNRRAPVQTSPSHASAAMIGSGSEAVETFAAVEVVGEAMLDAGYSVVTVHAALEDIARVNAYPFTETVVLPTALFVSARGGGEMRTGAVSSGHSRLLLHQIDALDELVRASRTGKLDPAQTIKGIAALRTSPPPYTRSARIGAYVVLCAGIAVLLGASWVGVAVSAVFGGFVGAALLSSARLERQYEPLVTVGLAFGVSAAVFLLARAGWDPGVLPSLMAPLIILLPGGLLTTGVIELATGQMVSGAGRLAAGFMQLTLLAVGIVAGATLIGIPEVTLTGAYQPVDPAWAWVAVAVFGVGIVVHQGGQRNSIPWTLLVLYVAYGAQVIGSVFFGGVLSALIGALVMTPVAIFVARHVSGPAAIVSFRPAFWLLVPGALGLVGVTTLLGGDSAGAHSGDNSIHDGRDRVGNPRRVRAQPTFALYPRNRALEPPLSEPRERDFYVHSYPLEPQ